MNNPITNRVAASALITINPEDYYPRGETMVFDLKEFLFMGMIIKEKEFREALKSADWEKYRNKNVAITCTTDAIIPMWAYMLVASYLQPVAKDMVVGNEKDLKRTLFIKNLLQINPNDFAGKRVVIKGCGEIPIEEFVYAEITKLLRPVAQSIMYGEPCSTVPVYKKPPATKGN